MTAKPPSRDDNETTTRTTRACPVCGTGFHPVRRQAYCTNACRQTAWRRRHQRPADPPVVVPAAHSRREQTIYQCGECGQRYLADQWCPDCNRPATRLGPGGTCDCGELLTVEELLIGSRQ